jgi:hypothetical protein
MGLGTVYCIVKFVPDLERQEPINVGVILANDNGIWHRFVDRPDAIGDPGAVRRFDELVGHLIDQELSRPGATRVDGRGFLLELSDRSFSHFLLTEPRAIDDHGEAEETLLALAERLAAAPAGASHLFSR